MIVNRSNQSACADRLIFRARAMSHRIVIWVVIASMGM